MNFISFPNDKAVRIKDIPVLSMDDFQQGITDCVSDGMRVATLFGMPAEQGKGTGLVAILADDRNSTLLAAITYIKGESYPSLTPHCPQVHLFEREIAEQHGLTPKGHPWFKPVRYHHTGGGSDPWKRPGDRTVLPAVGDFFTVDGDIHEVAVGPVHAGVIEPGHFRFQCRGEEVLHLEIALGYQHRGVEEAMAGGPGKRSLHYAETLAGDTTIGHTTSYCHVVEALSGCRKNPRAQVLAGIALELERLANHTGDLGALSGDVGFLPTSSFCGRIRGDFLNMSALLCGNRFGRGMMKPGGTGFDMDRARISELRRMIDTAEKEATSAIHLLWDTQSVMARFEDTGRLPADVAAELGIVGPAARASGLMRDARFNQPSGIFKMVQIPVSTYETGDVFGRALVRWFEMMQSMEFIREQLSSMPSGPVMSATGSIAPGSLAVSINEGWRGEICHAALTDRQGRFLRYKITDPSFHNWQGLSYVLRGQDISDFPLCNKSFNLSYCGHDL